MDMTAILKLIAPWLSQAARDVLRTLGTYLVAKGVIQNNADLTAFIGAGMTIVGIFWGWFTTSGYLQLAGLLKKITNTSSHADAVKAAEVLPPAAAVDSAVKAAKVTAAVAKVVLIAFALSFLVGMPQAMAQVRKPAVTGNLPADIKTDLGISAATPAPNLPIDPLHLNGSKPTGNVNADMKALWDKIIAADDADLTYAVAMAKAANTPSSAVRLQCLNAILALNQQASGANLKNADGTKMVKPDAHLISDVESVAEIVDNLSPTGPLFVGCAGAAQLAKTNVLSFVNAAVTGAAGFAAMPVIPGL